MSLSSGKPTTLEVMTVKNICIGSSFREVDLVHVHIHVPVHDAFARPPNLPPGPTYLGRWGDTIVLTPEHQYHSDASGELLIQSFSHRARDFDLGSH